MQPEVWRTSPPWRTELGVVVEEEENQAAQGEPWECQHKL